MRTERLLAHIGQGWFLQGHVAGGAAIDHVLLGNPYLMNATFEAVLKASRIRTVANHLFIESLIVAPLAEKILGGGNRGDYRQQDADRGKAARRCPREKPDDAAELI